MKGKLGFFKRYIKMQPFNVCVNLTVGLCTTDQSSDKVWTYFSKILVCTLMGTMGYHINRTDGKSYRNKLPPPPYYGGCIVKEW